MADHFLELHHPFSAEARYLKEKRIKVAFSETIIEFTST